MNEPNKPKEDTTSIPTPTATPESAIKAEERPVINTVEPPVKTYIFNKKTQTAQSAVQNAVFLIELSKYGGFFSQSKQFANTVFNSAIDTFPNNVSVPSQTSFNITSAIKMSMYKDDFLKTPSLLTDAAKFEQWEKNKTQSLESIVLTNPKEGTSKLGENYLCENINFLISFFFGSANVLTINNIKYTVSSKKWINTNYAKNVCDVSAISLQYKPEYLKFYKNPFTLSSAQQKLKQTRDSIDKLKEKLKKPDTNYYATLQTQLELNKEQAFEAFLSIQVIYNEWITIKRPIYAGGDRKEPVLAPYTLDELRAMTPSNDTELDLYITRFLKMMVNMYQTAYYFTQMNLETLSLVRKKKTEIYNSSELKTVVRNLDRIQYTEGGKDDVYLYKESSHSTSRTSKVESLIKDIDKEQDLPLLLGTFLVFDLILKTSGLFVIKADRYRGGSRYIYTKSDTIELVKNLFNLDTSYTTYKEVMAVLMDKYYNYSQANPDGPSPLDYERLLNAYGIFYYLSHYNYCLTNTKTQIEQMKGFDMDLLNRIYSSWSAKKRVSTAAASASATASTTAALEEEKIRNSISGLNGNMRAIYRTLSSFSNTSMSMYVDAPINLQKIISVPGWMPNAGDSFDWRGSEMDYAHFLYLNATITKYPDFKTPTFQNVEKLTSDFIRDSKIAPSSLSTTATRPSAMPPPTPPTVTGGGDSIDAISTFSSTTAYVTEQSEINRITEIEDLINREIVGEGNVVLTPLVISPSRQVENLCFNKNIRMTQILKSQASIQSAFTYLRKVITNNYDEPSYKLDVTLNDRIYLHTTTPPKEYVDKLYNERLPPGSKIIYLVNNLAEDETYRVQIFPPPDNSASDMPGYYLILQEGNGCYIYYDVTYTPNANLITHLDTLTRSECVNLFLFPKSGGRSTEGTEAKTNTYYVEVSLTVSAVNKAEVFKQECEEKMLALSTKYKALRNTIGNSTFIAPDFGPLVEEAGKLVKSAAKGELAPVPTPTPSPSPSP